MTVTSFKLWNWAAGRRRLSDEPPRNALSRRRPVVDPQRLGNHLLRDLGMRPGGRSLSVFEFHED